MTEELPAIAQSNTCFLFEINGLYISTVFGSYGWEIGVEWVEQTYQEKIVKDSFSGVPMRVDFSSRLYAPSEITFKIENVDGGIDIDDIKSQLCLVTLMVAGRIVRSWNFFIRPGDVNEYYGTISVKAVDILQPYIWGDYPNTPLVSAVLPGDTPCADTAACVPKVFNIAYLPIAPGMADDKNYYVLGQRSWDYNHYAFESIRAPKSVSDAEWLESAYDFEGQTIVGVDGKNYVGVQAIIHDSDGDDTADANGIWVGAGGKLSPRIRFSEYNAYFYHAGFGKALYGIFCEFDAYAYQFLDWPSFSALDTAMASIITVGDPYINFGMIHKEPREAFLSDYLSCFDCFMSVGTKISIHQFDSESTETFGTNEIEELTFEALSSDTEDIDGMSMIYVRYAEDTDDAPTGSMTVPIYSGQDSIDNPSGETFVFRFGLEDTDIPSIFGQLYAQKKYDRDHNARFSAAYTDVTTLATIIPGFVVTVEGDTIYGAEQDVVITELLFTPAGRLEISGTVYNHLEDAADITPITPTGETADGTDYTVSTYTVTAENDATSDIILDGDTVHIPSGYLKADAHPAFQVTMSEDQENIAVGSDVTLEFDTETNDNAGDFNTTTYTFAAPSDGWYQFNINVRFKQVDTDATEIALKLVTSNATFYHVVDARNLATADGYPSAAFGQLAWMDAEDTALVKINITGGAAQTDIQASASFFSGFYVNQ